MAPRFLTPSVVACAALTLVALTGCSPSAAPESAAPTVTVTQTVPASAPPVTPVETATPTPEVPACSGLTQEEAVSASIGSIAPFPGLESHEWVAATPDAATYDECAELSYVAVTLSGGTDSTPCHIMLFNQGRYLGTATADAYGFLPSVARLDDASIEVTYTYTLPGEANAESSGRVQATFTWDEDTQSVVMDGDVPPTD
ncbi:LppP/LprE family lipoprotein [Pseudoclavibacter sp. VKM Ac-2867]|uniref:LppP/LprE family lipoprotein n=1 Tax=Pseudoclavibacter sp. VKM Ac-2867 TaxID=2783829 RepID=UPI00188AFFED|nr:LppP/LprE family lipoprotein [Pseudoclavibacter sp. VKM Ac-2867]MBF4460048.1 LppP/LprE family lipoprotein [Pseudoclavibacter sp. VKM Ac-2867]